MKVAGCHFLRSKVNLSVGAKQREMGRGVSRSRVVCRISHSEPSVCATLVLLVGRVLRCRTPRVPRGFAGPQLELWAVCGDPDTTTGAIWLGFTSASRVTAPCYGFRGRFSHWAEPSRMLVGRATSSRPPQTERSRSTGRQRCGVQPAAQAGRRRAGGMPRDWESGGVFGVNERLTACSASTPSEWLVAWQGPASPMRASIDRRACSAAAILQTAHVRRELDSSGRRTEIGAARLAEP